MAIQRGDRKKWRGGEDMEMGVYCTTLIVGLPLLIQCLHNLTLYCFRTEI